MRGGKTRDVPAFPDIEAELGYNPARFLDQKVGKNGKTEELTAKALICGVQEVEHLRLWIRVEEELGRGRNGGPRQEVAKWIGTRQVTLQQQADGAATHDNTSAHEPSPETADDSDVSDTSSGSVEQVEGLTDAAETASDDAVADPATQSPSTAATTTSAAAVATDGGEPPSTPRCPDPDCRGKLAREEIDDDEVAHWCSYCGQFKEPMDETDPVEAVA